MTGTQGGPFRSIDGSGNNLIETGWGSAGSDFLRLAPSDYGDQVSSPAGGDRPGAREVSNAVIAQDEDKPSALGTSDLFWAWGQFLDHDIDLTAAAPADQAESFNIPVPAGDPYFDPFNTGTVEIPLTRSGAAPGSGSDAANPREQVNEITAFIDASMVYGADPARAAALRDEGGKLKTSPGELLPFDDGSLPNAGPPGGFLAGDVRANENLGLTSLQTIFVREHNRLVEEIADEHPDYDDERLYQEAKALVEAKVQVITYKEFLPLLLGPDALADYEGYQADVDPGIANIFATAAYRVGHTMLSTQLYRMEESGAEASEGHLDLRDAFFAPQRLIDEGGVDPLLRGLAAGVSQEIDVYLVDEVRNFLFGPPGAGGFDLASLNIQRGRDHGLPSYNEARIAYGLDPVTAFAEVTSDAEIAAKLASVYDTVDEIDVFVGGLAEDHVEGAVVGELFQAVLVDQFTRLRDGDRFWYEERFSGEELEALEATTLAQVIRDNSGVEHIQDQAMLAYNRIGGDEQAEHMEGTWSRDLMMGEGGSDVLKGETGDDQIYGGDGNDKVMGGPGDDKLEGDAGADRLRGEAGDDWLEGGEGADRESGGGGHDHIEGGDGADRLYGGSGDDWIDGGDGADRIRGGAGDDRIDGGADADRLYGESGDDVLIGGGGADQMRGGSGADSFLYESPLDFGDLIMDFDPLEDLLDLRPVTGGEAATVRIEDFGMSVEVYLETASLVEVKVAELWGVEAELLSVGSDAEANILV